MTTPVNGDAEGAGGDAPSAVVPPSGRRDGGPHGGRAPEPSAQLVGLLRRDGADHGVVRLRVVEILEELATEFLDHLPDFLQRLICIDVHEDGD